MLRNFASHGNARDAQLVALSVVALHQHADGVSARFRIEHAGRSSDPSLEFIADHACSAANVALFDRASVGGIERAEDMLGLYVKSIDVVKIAVPGLCDYRQ